LEPHTAASEVFATNYADARSRFRAACADAWVEVETRPHPLSGPDGGDLSTDIAWIGPRDARKVMLLMSSTHGVEGFCGSACQIDWLRECGADGLPPDTATLIVHAINPHGFAWLRRVNEDGCDLNRNHVDFSLPLPENSGHDELVDAFVPKSLDAETLAAADTAVDAFKQTKGETAYRIARQAGQYKHAHSTFYGGAKPTWSRRIFEDILADYDLPGRDFTIVLDYHTGLGPYGYGEMILTNPVDGPGPARALAIYNETVGIPLLGTSTSVQVHGSWGMTFERAFTGGNYLGFGLEYGTYQQPRGLQVMRADHWLYAYGKGGDGEIDLNDPAVDKIRQAMKDHSFPDELGWKEAVLWRSRQVQRQSLAALATLPA